jgi:hypothetical protein
MRKDLFQTKPLMLGYVAPRPPLLARTLRKL